MKQLLRPREVFDGDSLLDRRTVLIEDGVIAAVTPEAAAGPAPAGCEVLDFPDCTLVPGFIDLQVNGGGGLLFNEAPGVETLERIGSAHGRFGTTGFLPTLVTDGYEVMRRAVAAVNEAIAAGVPGVLGIHFEGPFLNPARKGVHDAALMRGLDDEGFEILTSLERGVTLVTLAPEIVSPAAIARLVEAGVIVSAGHSEASYEQVRRALKAGLSGFTHLFNAMPPMRSREPGIVGAALEDADSWFGIVADGHHVHPAMVRLAVTAKNPGGAVLVTDAMPSVGSREKSFTLYGRTVRVENGRCTTREGTLAGSDLDMLSAVDKAREFCGVDWFEAVRMASLYPARALGLDGVLGRIKPGYAASLLAVDEDRALVAGWIRGERIGLGD